MSEFLYVYRGGSRPSAPEQMQQVMQKWMAWMRELGAQGHMKDPGHPLEPAGKLVSGQRKSVTDGPYAEKDVVGGYSIIEARDLAQAAELSAGCPILEGGGVVEIRPIMRVDM
jgi:hypothetical protein